MSVRIPVTVSFYFFILLFFNSCGLEDYPYIFPVYQANVETMQMDTWAKVRIDNNNQSNDYFSNFSIFYKIYLSDYNNPGNPSIVLNIISPALYSDYNYFYNYIDSTTNVTDNMESLFMNRGFKYLYFEGSRVFRMDELLTSSVFNRYLVFDFSSLGGPPTIEITQLDGSPDRGPFQLMRSKDGFDPLPTDRYLTASDELRSGKNIDDKINGDIATISDPLDSYLYAYVAMYIVATGYNPVNYQSVYSTPSLIHIFRLP